MAPSKLTHGFTHHLRFRSFVGILIIGFFIVMSQLIIHALLNEQLSSSHTINLAGRQRMFSQRIAKNVVILNQPTDPSIQQLQISELTETLSLLERVHEGLQQGDSELGLPGINSEAVKDLFASLATDYQQITTSAQCILDFENNIERDMCNEDAEHYVQTILTHEQSFLSIMNAIVFQYDIEAQEDMFQLRNTSYLITLVGCMGLIAIWVGVLSSAIEKVELSQTQLRDQAVALAEARDEAVLASSIKSQILMNISHDARTPLSSIMLSTDMIRKTAKNMLSEKQKSYLNTITHNAKRLNIFLQNLLDQAKLETGSVQLENKRIDFEQVSLELESTLKPLAETKGLNWTITYAADFSKTISGDHVQLMRILTNLGHNAIKFTDNGNIAIHFIMHDEQFWGFSVKDTGQGISMDGLASIFDKFWQADGSSTRQNQTGVGLGLAIVKSLTHQMGGCINVESTVGQGTEFKVWMPKDLSQVKNLNHQ